MIVGRQTSNINYTSNKISRAVEIVKLKKINMTNDY